MPILHLLVVPAGQRTCTANGVGFRPLGLPTLSVLNVGPENETQPRINSGSPDHDNQQRFSQNPSLPHPCQFCDRSFATKSGLGVHTRRAHPEDFDRMHTRVDVKKRWCEEEILLIARKEAELVVHSRPRFINKALAEIFPDRSIEAIKKARQKPEYREAVNSYIEEITLRTSQGSMNPTPARSSTTDELTPGTNPEQQLPSDNHLISDLLSLPKPVGESYKSTILQSILENALIDGKETTLGRLSSYLVDIFPGIMQNNARPHSNIISATPTANRRILRRREYAEIQKHWSKHQGRCIKSILEGPSEAKIPPIAVMEPYWRTVMENNKQTFPPNENLQQPLENLWSTITCQEIRASRPPLSTSPGADGITSRQLRAIPEDILVRVLNLIIWCGKIPIMLTKSKTIFIPKKCQAIDPGDFRPITIPSLFIRHLHSILAKRLSSLISLDPRQRGFRPTDGCSDNTTLVDLLLRHHHETYSSCYLASLDISKAFDSVSHNTIFGTLESYGLPLGFITYLKSFYQTSYTTLIGGNWISANLYPKSGVKQGDPLSPILFKIIIDRLLKSLPKEIGCYIGETKSNAIAFADDLILFGSTPQGLQDLIDHTEKFLESCGLALNQSKCISISIKGQPKQKRTVITQNLFTVSNRSMRALQRSDEWTYLGIIFTPEGRIKCKPHDMLLKKLDLLTKAPLKPQQRLHALRTVLIPQLFHQLTLGNVMVGSLNKVDRIIRFSVRKWLDLPKDTTSSFFHASIDAGGLGLQSLRWTAPLLRKARLENLQLPNLDEVAVANIYIANEINKCEKRLKFQGESLLSSEDVEKFWSKRLHSTVDGSGLQESSHNHQAHRWIREPTKLLSGRDFLHCIKLRINALPSRSRTSRGRYEIDRSCRAGCQASETTNHILQQCHRTHAARIDRHNSVAKFLVRSLKAKGYNTVEEPILVLPEGNRKPDIIATTDNKIIVLDAQIVTDGYIMEAAHERKKNYYDTPSIRQHLIEQYGPNDLSFATATLNWRGIWCKSSVNQLLDLEIIRNTDTALISTRVAIGGVRSFRIFNQTTSRTYRTGVG